MANPKAPSEADLEAKVAEVVALAPPLPARARETLRAIFASPAVDRAARTDQEAA